MIFGRPVNLVLGAITAVFNVVVVAAHTVPGLENLGVILNDVLVSTINLAIGALVAVVANQTPTVNAGDPVHVIQPGDTPNTTVTV